MTERKYQETQEQAMWRTYYNRGRYETNYKPVPKPPAMKDAGAQPLQGADPAIPADKKEK